MPCWFTSIPHDKFLHNLYKFFNTYLCIANRMPLIERSRGGFQTSCSRDPFPDPYSLLLFRRSSLKKSDKSKANQLTKLLPAIAAQLSRL